MTTRGELTLFPKNVRTPEQLGRWRARVYQTFQDYLEQQGLNLTHQRKAVVDYLMTARDHVGLDELYELLRKKHVEIGRTTVFRTLKLLDQSGLASRVSAKDDTGRYELKYDRPHHDHLICVECGVIIEFRSPEMEHYQNEGVKRHGFQMLWHRHEMFGRCRACQEEKKERT